MVVMTSLEPPSEGVRVQQPATAAHLGTKALGSGTLYIAESRVSWAGADGQGFSLEYPHIMLHAVSRDTSTFPHPCLYLMVDANLCPEERPADGGGGSSDEDGESGSGSSVTEVRFVPSEDSALDVMFCAMSECQSLHPDPNDSATPDEDDIFQGGDFDDGGGGGDGHVGLANGAGGDGHDEPMETGQFDDPED